LGIYWYVGKWGGGHSLFAREIDSCIDTISALTFDSEKTGEFVVLEGIEVCVRVDLSILVTLLIVVFVVSGEARVGQNFEISDLSLHLALSCFRKNCTVAIYFHLYCSLCQNEPMINQVCIISIN
jgi:hypothetical protein